MKKRTNIVQMALTICLVLIGTGKTLAIDVLKPGYVVETYATYSQPGLAPTRSIEFDDESNLYIAHQGNDSIWRVASNKVASEFVTGVHQHSIAWGGGTTYGDYLYAPDGEINGQIRKIAKDGTVSSFTSFGPPQHGLGLAAFDRTGNYGGYFYTATAGQDHTYKIDSGGNITMFSDFPGWKNGGGPGNIAFDMVGNYNGLMYMSTSFNNDAGNQLYSGLFSLDSRGNASRFTEDLVLSIRIDFDQTGVFFNNKMFAIGESAFGEGLSVWQIDTDGTAEAFATTTTSLNDLIFGADGAMYVAEYSEVGEMMTISRIVPEPATLILFGLGAVIVRKRKRN